MGGAPGPLALRGGRASLLLRLQTPTELVSVQLLRSASCSLLLGGGADGQLLVFENGSGELLKVRT